MAKKKFRETYNYECSITEEQFTTRRKADNPEELISIKAYYELNPDMDDRPQSVKQRLENQED